MSLSKAWFSPNDSRYHLIGSSNNLAVFQENYLELLGFEAEAKAVGIGEALIAGPIGLNSVAFRTEDGEHTFQSLMKRNVPAIPPETFSRPVELPNGTFDARFTVVRLEAKNLSTPNLFYCHHLLRNWYGAANGWIMLTVQLGSRTWWSLRPIQRATRNAFAI